MFQVKFEWLEACGHRQPCVNVFQIVRHTVRGGWDFFDIIGPGGREWTVWGIRGRVVR